MSDLALTFHPGLFDIGQGASVLSGYFLLNVGGEGSGVAGMTGCLLLILSRSACWKPLVLLSQHHQLDRVDTVPGFTVAAHHSPTGLYVFPLMSRAGIKPDLSEICPGP